MVSESSYLVGPSNGGLFSIRVLWSDQTVCERLLDCFLCHCLLCCLLCIYIFFLCYLLSVHLEYVFLWGGLLEIFFILNPRPSYYNDAIDRLILITLFFIIFFFGISCLHKRKPDSLIGNNE